MLAGQVPKSPLHAEERGMLGILQFQLLLISIPFQIFTNNKAILYRGGGGGGGGVLPSILGGRARVCSALLETLTILFQT